jgi:hypothetical protein
MITIEEFTDLFEILVAAYPNHKFKSEDDMGKTIVVWYSLLNDLPKELLEAAIRKHILQSETSFFPSVKEIRAKAIEIVQPEEDKNTAAEAWGEVLKAVRYYGHCEEAKALESLNSLTRKVTQAIGFRTICMADENEIGVVRGQFLKMYGQISERNKQEALLPEGLRNQIQAIENKGLKALKK